MKTTKEVMDEEISGKSRFELSPWDRENNPLFFAWTLTHVDLFSRTDDGRVGKMMKEYRIRDECIERYGFAIPTEDVLRKVIEVSPKGIVEIGAGTGYWAKRLQMLGADVIACDDSSGAYRFQVGSQFPVERVSYQRLFRTKAVHERTLLVVWPNADNVNIFDRYKGDTVIYVGEIHEGCTGYDPKIEETWEMVKHVEIPVWSGIHDSMGIFKRKVR